MTKNTRTETRVEHIQRQIQFVKMLQEKEVSWDFKRCYDGMIDDLEILILNIPEEEIDTANEDITKTPSYPEGDSHMDMSGASDNGDR